MAKDKRKKISWWKILGAAASLQFMIPVLKTQWTAARKALINVNDPAVVDLRITIESLLNVFED